MAFKIYTKGGDKGETSLFGGMRLSKNHIRIESYGQVDELNSYIGLVRELLKRDDQRILLKEVQDRLFTIGSQLASDPTKEMKVPDVHESDITLLENAIDNMNEDLPPLKTFILPGGSPTVAHAHVARCVCRRAERAVVALNQLDAVEPILIKYLNRLSDYLFVLGRQIAQDEGVAELGWKPRM